MKGFIKITVNQHDENGLQVQSECRLENVGIADKIMLLGCFAEALEMDDSDLIAAAHTLPQVRQHFSTESIAINTDALDGFKKGES